MNNSTMTSFNRHPQANQGLKEIYRLLPIAVAIIVTNGLVFFLFYRRKSLRSSSNYLLLGLAVCDFLTGAVNIPYYIIFSFNVVPWTSPMFEQFAFWMYTLHTFMAVSAAYHILVITAEKYLAILQPLRHHMVTKKAVFKVLVGIWLISGLIALIPLVWQNAKSNLGYIIHSSFCLVFVFLVPYVFMLYAFTLMFKTVSGRKRPSQQRRKERLQKKARTDRKCILVFALMAAIYFCCWLPYFTLMLTVNIKIYYNTTTGDSVIDKALDVFVIMRYVTSASNPLLYTFFKRDIWRALRGLSKRRKSGFISERASSLRISSLRYFFLKRRSTSLDSAQSAEAGTNVSQLSFTARNRFFEDENNKHANEQYVVYISSV